MNDLLDTVSDTTDKLYEVLEYLAKNNIYNDKSGGPYQSINEMVKSITGTENCNMCFANITLTKKESYLKSNWLSIKSDIKLWTVAIILFIGSVFLFEDNFEAIMVILTIAQIAFFVYIIIVMMRAYRKYKEKMKGVTNCPSLLVINNNTLWLIKEIILKEDKHYYYENLFKIPKDLITRKKFDLLNPSFGFSFIAQELNVLATKLNNSKLNNFADRIEQGSISIKEMKDKVLGKRNQKRMLPFFIKK